MPHLNVETKSREYPVDVAWSDEFQRFVATAPDWGPAVVGGRTQEEALRRARAVIEAHIERLLQEGQPLPTPYVAGSVKSR